MGSVGHNAIGRVKLATDFRQERKDSGVEAVREVARLVEARRAALWAQVLMTCGIIGVFAVVVATIAYFVL